MIICISVNVLLSIGYCTFSYICSNRYPSESETLAEYYCYIGISGNLETQPERIPGLEAFYYILMSTEIIFLFAIIYIFLKIMQKIIDNLKINCEEDSTQ